MAKPDEPCSPVWLRRIEQMSPQEARRVLEWSGCFLPGPALRALAERAGIKPTEGKEPEGPKVVNNWKGL